MYVLLDRRIQYTNLNISILFVYICGDQQECENQLHSISSNSNDDLDDLLRCDNVEINNDSSNKQSRYQPC